MHSTFDPAILIPERCSQTKYLHSAPATERLDLCAHLMSTVKPAAAQIGGSRSLLVLVL
jgi:hypothetical protein